MLNPFSGRFSVLLFRQILAASMSLLPVSLWVVYESGRDIRRCGIFLHMTMSLRWRERLSCSPKLLPLGSYGIAFPLNTCTGPHGAPPLTPTHPQPLPPLSQSLSRNAAYLQLASLQSSCLQSQPQRWEAPFGGMAASIHAYGATTTGGAYRFDEYVTALAHAVVGTLATTCPSPTAVPLCF